MDPQALWGRMQSFGLGRLSLMGGAFLGVCVLLYLLVVRVSTPEMAPLYQGLDAQDTTKIVEALNANAVSFDVREGSIFVPEGEVLRSRMLLAEAGVAVGGGVGYEIFDKGDVLSTTHFVQKVNLLRALEGELARTIQTLQSVQRARVHIVMPERRMFIKDKRKPSAAIVLRMRRGQTLEGSQVKAIRSLVASSVPDMQVEKVSVLDDRGVLLASGDGPDGKNMSMALDEMRAVTEARLGRMIESLLEKTLGPGNVRAEVTVEIDHDRVTEQSEQFDPEGQVVRSQQNVNNRSKSDAGAQRATTVQQNVPAAQQSQGSGNSSSEDAKEEETTNYEISKTVKTAIREMGRIKRFSVAVLVDGIHSKKSGGEAAGGYKPRSDEDLEKIKRLVQAAMGYQEERGDVVDVVNLEFQRADLAGEEEPSWWQRMSDRQVIRLVEIGFLGVLLLLLFLFGVRPSLNQMAAARQVAKDAEAAVLVTGKGADGQGGAQDGTQGEVGTPGAESTLSTEDQEELRGWEGLPEDELGTLVNKFVQAYPERAAAVLRIWMKG